MVKQSSEPQVTKRRVTMTNVVVSEREGQVVTQRIQATDFVRPDYLDAYVADANTRWELVQISDEPDAGPAGYHGQTYVPEHLDHPLAGQTFPETPKADR